MPRRTFSEDVDELRDELDALWFEIRVAVAGLLYSAARLWNPYDEDDDDE